MESKTFWVVVFLGIVFFSTLVFGFILNGIAKEEIQQPKTEYRIYHMKYGGAFCGDISYHNCGITLRNCTDDKEYYCLHDVSVEVEK